MFAKRGKIGSDQKGRPNHENFLKEPAVKDQPRTRYKVIRSVR